VSTCHYEGRDSGSSKSGGDSVPLLGDIDLTVPFSPSFGRCEHASSTTHVTECALSGAGGSSSSNARDTSNGATGSPRAGRHLFSSVDVDGISLAVVLVHVGVHKLNNIGTKRSGHDLGQGGITGFLPSEGEDRNKGTGGHFNDNKPAFLRCGPVLRES